MICCVNLCLDTHSPTLSRFGPQTSPTSYLLTNTICGHLVLVRFPNSISTHTGRFIIYPPTPVKGSCRRVRFLFLVVIVNLVQLMLSCLLPPFMVPPHDPNRLHRGGEGGSSKLINWALRTFTARSSRPELTRNPCNWHRRLAIYRESLSRPVS